MAKKKSVEMASSSAISSSGGAETVTLSKNTLLVGVVVVLVALLALSVITGGFGLKTATTGSAGGTAGGTGGTGNNPSPSPSPSPAPSPQALSTVQVDGGRLPALGQASAPVTLIEFSDFQCPYCERHYRQTEPSIKQNYIDTGKVKFYYRDYPLPIHPNADDAALAASCANDQNKFWEYHNKLFDTQQAWSDLDANAVTTTLVADAGALGMDTTAFQTCLTSKQHETDVGNDIAAAQQAYGGSLGTPTFFILIPKDKTTQAQLEQAIGGQYAQYTGLAQTNSDYVVMITGALPYSVFKSVFDAVRY